MAQRVDVDLIVEAISKGFENVQRDMKGIENQQKSLDRTQQQSTGILDKVKDNWQAITLGLGAAYGAVQSVKKVWEFSAEGAQIEKVRGTFDSLTASIGETSEALLTDLRAATANMVADTELMASANRFLSMGLAETGDQASELSRIAVTLGAAMGKDATAAMEEFALLLSNQSIPRLDTFGISAGRVRERIKELQDADKDMSRETAFMTAVMKEAEISMEKLGGEVPVDAFTQFEVQTKNLTDELKMMLAEGLGPVVGKLAEAATDFNENRKLVEELSKAVDDGIITQKQFEQAFHDVKEGTNDNTEALQELADQARETRQEIARLQYEMNVVGDTGAHYSAALGRALESTEDLDEETEKLTDSLDDLKKQFDEDWGYQTWGANVDVLERAARHIDELVSGIGDTGDDFRIGAKNIGLLNEELDELGPKYVTWGGRTADQNRLLGDMSDEVDRLNRQIADAQAAPEMFGGVEEAAKVIEKATERINELNPAINRFNNITGEAGLVTVEATANIDAMNKQLFEQVSASNDSEDAIIAMGLALGVLNEEQADAIVKSFELTAGINEIEAAFNAETISAETARQAIMILAEDGIEAMRNFMNQMIWTADEAAALEAKIIAIGTAIDNLPKEKRIQIRTEFNDPAAGGYLSGRGAVYNPPSNTGGSSGGGSGGPSERQIGGPVSANMPYIVGEAGPELFVPNTAGRILSNQDTRAVGGAGGSVTINVYPQSQMDVTRAIDRGLQRAGLAANKIKRTL